MQTTVQTIPLVNLAIAFIPVLAVLVLFKRWQLNLSNAIYALSRMLGQLLLIGYCLNYVFASDSAYLIVGILVMMVLCSGWISLNMVSRQHRLQLYKKALYAIALGGGVPLLIMTQAVIQLQPWYEPRYMIALGGMVFANAMNNVSLAAERFGSEISRDVDYKTARNIAFNAAMIPVINSLFAVGLVSLPGMMTGQILSGISPFIAARYQIMVMCMIFSAAGLTTACFLILMKPNAGSTSNHS
jgi:putative ABC transport system permease protein